MRLRTIIGLGLLTAAVFVSSENAAKAQLPPTIPLTIIEEGAWVNAFGQVNSSTWVDPDEPLWAYVLGSDATATCNAQIQSRLVVGIVGSMVSGLNTTASAIGQISALYGGFAAETTWEFGGAKAIVGDGTQFSSGGFGPGCPVAHGSLGQSFVGDDFSWAGGYNEIRRNGITMAYMAGGVGWYTQIVNGQEEQVYDATAPIQTTFYVNYGTIVETINCVVTSGAVQNASSVARGYTVEDIYVTEW